MRYVNGDKSLSRGKPRRLYDSTYRTAGWFEVWCCCGSYAELHEPLQSIWMLGQDHIKGADVQCARCGRQYRLHLQLMEYDGNTVELAESVQT